MEERKRYVLAGVGAGFLTALGFTLLRGFLAGETGLGWLRFELDQHRAFYRVLLVFSLLAPVIPAWVFGSGRQEIRMLKRALERVQAQFQALSATDELTGLYHRAHVLELLDKEIVRAVRYGRSLSCILFGVDGMAGLNEAFGRSAGDYVLKEIALYLRRHVRTIDVMGRYESEVFIVILPEATRERALGVADRISRGIAALPLMLGDRPFKASVSAGSASFFGSGIADRNGFLEQAREHLNEVRLKAVREAG